MIDWRLHIEQRPDFMGGRATCRGTRLTVEHLLERLADGWAEADLLESYPQLTPDHLRASFAYAADSLSQERVFALADR